MKLLNNSKEPSALLYLSVATDNVMGSSRRSRSVSETQIALCEDCLLSPTAQVTKFRSIANQCSHLMTYVT